MGDETSTEGDVPSFADWFISLPGRSIYAKIPISYFEDDFNLFEAHSLPHFDTLLDVILTDEPPEDEVHSDEELMANLIKFYEIVHQRYIITRSGMHEMVRESFAILQVTNPNI